VRLEGLGQLKKIHLIEIRTRDLPACGIVPSSNYATACPLSVLVHRENIFTNSYGGPRIGEYGTMQSLSDLNLESPALNHDNNNKFVLPASVLKASPF
jgi:hypothetical protein